MQCCLETFLKREREEALDIKYKGEVMIFEQPAFDFIHILR